jgi:predicted MPP superfamily phosphohydrolase
VEPELLAVRQVTVESPTWRGPPLRIGVLSDTHVGEPHMPATRVEKIAGRLSREKPDLIVLVGDYVGGHLPMDARHPAERDEIARGITALRSARAPLGQVAVLGNHDWWYDGPTIEAALQREAVVVLENHAVQIRRPGSAFWVAGVADDDSRRAAASIPMALASVPPEDPVILLSHRPDPFAEAPARVALTIAAHSHCGQVNLPWIGRPIVPSPGSRRWPCGLYSEAGRQLFVTGGVGTSILPVRFRARPEIVIVTLRARP